MFSGKEILIVLILLGTIAVPAVFYLLALQRAFEAVSPENCEMNPPGLVWLSFIPIFGLGWTFVIVIKLANSIKKEYAALGIQEECSGAFGAGQVFAICSVFASLGWFDSYGRFTSLVSSAGIGALIFWIMHWAQVSGFRRTILLPPGTGSWQSLTMLRVAHGTFSKPKLE